MFDDLKEKVRELAEPVAAAEGMELIHIECLKMHTGWIVRLYLDKDGGVTLDDCSSVSNQLGDILDINDLIKSRYTLEVSSPGLERPISRDQDFVKYKGSQVNIKTAQKIDGAKNFHGILENFVEEDGRKIVHVNVAGRTFRIPKDEITKANLAYQNEKSI